MRLGFFFLAVALLLNPIAFGAEPEPYLNSAPMLFYPPLCRTARIQGTVTVRFEVNEQGDASDIEADGPSLLKEAVLQNVKAWKYSWNSPCPCRAKEKMIFKYILDDGTDVKGADLVVRWFGGSPVTRIDVETGPIVLNTDVNETKDAPKSPSAQPPE